MVTISIPVKPYIKTFLHGRFGDPVDMNCHSYIGKHFHLLLRNQTAHKDKYIRLTGYTQRVIIRTSEDVFFRHGHLLTSSSVAAFNSFLEDIIKEQMCMYIDARRSDKAANSKQAYEEFMDKFGFNDGSFAYEAIKKAYERYRRKLLSRESPLIIN